jgi:hypothetical protein
VQCGARHVADPHRLGRFSGHHGLQVLAHGPAVHRLALHGSRVAKQTDGNFLAEVLALGGVGGTAVGFAAKDLLANCLGGLSSYLDRPFFVGEWICSPDKALKGTVEFISWRHTRIRAFNKNPICVPNALFTKILVKNPSRMGHRRIREAIGLRCEDSAAVSAIKADIETMLCRHPEIAEAQTLIVKLNLFGAPSLDIMVCTCIHQSLGEIPPSQARRAAEDWRDHQPPWRRDCVSLANAASGFFASSHRRRACPVSL